MRLNDLHQCLPTVTLVMMTIFECTWRVSNFIVSVLLSGRPDKDTIISYRVHMFGHDSSNPLIMNIIILFLCRFHQFFAFTAGSSTITLLSSHISLAIWIYRFCVVIVWSSCHYCIVLCRVHVAILSC